MEIRELRIGNLLISEGVVVTIDARSIFDMWDSGKNYSPIPITPEWLERLGFEQNLVYPGDTYFRKDKFEIVMDAEGDFNFYLIKHFSPSVWCVHQLQNLFYCLTGTELTLTK